MLGMCFRGTYLVGCLSDARDGFFSCRKAIAIALGAFAGKNGLLKGLPRVPGRSEC